MDMLLIALVVIFILVMLGESLRNVVEGHPEVSRKFIHITVAGFAATWPLFVSRAEIVSLSILLFIGIIASRYLSFFESIHSIGRKTWGEIFFAISFGLVAILTNNPYIYAAAILLMGVADGLAGIIGSVYGRRQSYRVFNNTKSVIGTATFWVAALIITFFFAVRYGIHANWTLLLWFPFAAALLENISTAGADNLFIPVFAVAVLSGVRVVAPWYADSFGTLMIIALAATIMTQLQPMPPEKSTPQGRILAYARQPVKHLLTRRR